MFTTYLKPITFRLIAVTRSVTKYGSLKYIGLIHPKYWLYLIIVFFFYIVEELLRMRSGVPIKKAGEKSCTTQFSFKKKDGSEMTIPIRFGLHAISKKVIIYI